MHACAPPRLHKKSLPALQLPGPAILAASCRTCMRRHQQVLSLCQNIRSLCRSRTALERKRTGQLQISCSGCIQSRPWINVGERTLVHCFAPLQPSFSIQILRDCCLIVLNLLLDRTARSVMGGQAIIGLAAICVFCLSCTSANVASGSTVSKELSTGGVQAFVYNPTLSANGTQVRHITARSSWVGNVQQRTS